MTDRLRPHPGPLPERGEQEPVAGGRTGALRAAVFGANDGLVSNLALIMGVAGAGVDRRVILVAGVAGLLAGAFSMAAGEYLSMRIQREMFERLIHFEAHEIAADPQGETRELADVLRRRGIPAPLAGQTAERLMADPDRALDVHAREELGLDPRSFGSPWGAAGSSIVTFSLGALVPLFPYFFTSGVTAAWIAVALAVIALFSVGAGMSAFTGKSWALSGLRMTAIGGAAALVTHLVGRLLGVTALA